MKFSYLVGVALFHAGGEAWPGKWSLFNLLCEHALNVRFILLICHVCMFNVIPLECVLFPRSRSRSRRRSRTRSRSRSRSRHSRSRSRRRSYTRSRSRSRSRSDSKSSRGKSRSRSKSPRESKSKSRSKSKWTGNDHLSFQVGSGLMCATRVSGWTVRLWSSVRTAVCLLGHITYVWHNSSELDSECLTRLKTRLTVHWVERIRFRN